LDDTANIVLDLVDGALSGPEWDAWLAAHPEAAAEVAVGRRVRALLAELRASEVALPVDFEARLLERVRTDRTLLDLLELTLSGVGRALIELINLLLDLTPAAPTAAA
jgi:anti-sigma factor RsiW